MTVLDRNGNEIVAGDKLGTCYDGCDPTRPLVTVALTKDGKVHMLDNANREFAITTDQFARSLWVKINPSTGGGA